MAKEELIVLNKQDEEEGGAGADLPEETDTEISDPAAGDDLEEDSVIEEDPLPLNDDADIE